MTVKINRYTVFVYILCVPFVVACSNDDTNSIQPNEVTSSVQLKDPTKETTAKGKGIGRIINGQFNRRIENEGTCDHTIDYSKPKS